MKFTAMTPELYEYVEAHGQNRDPVLEALIKETGERFGGAAIMQIAPEQGTFMSLLVKAIGARRAIEVGTFTGYSAISIARGLPEDGKLICCDVSNEYAEVAQRYFGKAGVADRIELRIGPALETLRALPAGPSFDFAFIDADKVSYHDYYEEILARLRPNGIIVFDNVLWMGQVIEPANTTDDTKALRALNDALAVDPRVQTVMLSVSDGITLVRKK